MSVLQFKASPVNTLSFETFEEAKERGKTTPLEVKEQSHTTSADNIERKLDQLSWPDGPPNWSKKSQIVQYQKQGK